MPSNNTTSMVILKGDNCSSFQDNPSVLKPNLLLPYSQNPLSVPFTKTFYIHFQVSHVFLLPVIHSIIYAYHPRGPNPRHQAKSFYWFHMSHVFCLSCPNQVSLINQTTYSEDKKTADAHKSSTILYFSFLLPLSCVNFLNTTSFPENVCRCYSFTLMLAATCSSGLQYYVCDWALNTYVLFSRWWLRTANHIIVCCW